MNSASWCTRCHVRPPSRVTSMDHVQPGEHYGRPTEPDRIPFWAFQNATVSGWKAGAAGVLGDGPTGGIAAAVQRADDGTPAYRPPSGPNGCAPPAPT